MPSADPMAHRGSYQERGAPVNTRDRNDEAAAWRGVEASQMAQTPMGLARLSSGRREEEGLGDQAF